MSEESEEVATLPFHPGMFLGFKSTEFSARGFKSTDISARDFKSTEFGVVPLPNCHLGMAQC
eukprot:108943-Pelagomonas_calceolata.AAC.1